MGDLIYILLAIAECSVLYSFAGLCYPRRKPNWIRWGLAAAFFATAVFFSAGNRVIFDVQFTMYMAFFQAIVFTVSLWAIYKVKLLFSFSVCYFYFAVIGLIESAGLSFLTLNRDFVADYELFWRPYTLYLTVLLALILILWIILVYRGHVKRKKLYFQLKPGILIVLGLVAQVLSYIYLNFDIMDTIYGLWLSMLLGSIAFFGVIAFLLISKNYARAMHESQLVRQQDIQLKEQLKEMARSEAEKAKMLHDHKHDFLLMKQLVSNGQQDALLEFLDEKILISDQAKGKYYTGNAMADFVLAMKEARAVDENIDFQVECTTLEETSGSYDLCILLSNLLDNALEACCEMAGKHPYIQVKLGRQGKMIWLHIMNSSARAPIVKNGQFMTSKPDKSLHGYGLMSVRQIVERYHGSIDFDYDDTYFSVKILMEY